MPRNRRPNSEKSKPIAFLVRHPETEVADLHIFVSWMDVDLSDEGKEQMQEVVDLLNEYDIREIYSSPLKRCVLFAEKYADGRPVLQHRSLLPWNRGILTGISQDQGEDALNLFLEHPDVRIPQGESRIECEDRLTEFFEPALKQAEKRPCVFFTHHSVIDVLNSLVEGKRRTKLENLVKPAGVVAVYLDGDGYRLEAIHNADEGQAGLS